MRKLTTFSHISLDGYFKDSSSEMTFAHRQDAEWNEFVVANAGSGGGLVFGRVTYDMMSGFWPTEQAKKAMPAVAERMNSLEKVVFSKTMKKPSWNNARVVSGDMAGEVSRMKSQDGSHLTVLGSGSVVAQLAEAGLVDEFTFVLNPIALGAGATLFEGITKRLALRLVKSRVFNNGNLVLSYAPQN